MSEPELFRKIYCTEGSTCDIFLTFRRSRSDSAPLSWFCAWEIVPPYTPRYAPTGGPSSSKISPHGSNFQLSHCPWYAWVASRNLRNTRSALAFALMMELIHLIAEDSISCSFGATFFFFLQHFSKFTLWITQCTTNMLGLSSYMSKQAKQLDIYQSVWLWTLWTSAFSFCIPPKIGS